MVGVPQVHSEPASLESDVRSRRELCSQMFRHKAKFHLDELGTVD